MVDVKSRWKAILINKIESSGQSQHEGLWLPVAIFATSQTDVWPLDSSVHWICLTC